MRRLIKHIPVLAILLLIACNNQSDTQEVHGADMDTYVCPMHSQVVAYSPGTCPICFMNLVHVNQQLNSGSEIILSENQVRLANIQVQVLDNNYKGGEVILSGQFTTNQALSSVVKSLSSGRIERLFIKKKGVVVKEGQPLYAIYSEKLLTLQNEYLALQEQNRQSNSKDQHFLVQLENTRKKLERYGMTHNQIANLARSGRTEPQTIFYAPATGIITEIQASEGESIGEGSDIYTLEKMDPILVEAELYPGEASVLSQGQKINVSIAGHGSEKVAGIITHLGPSDSLDSRIVKLKVELNNPDYHLVPGMSANIYVPKGEQKPLLVPKEAIIRDKQGSHVWVEKQKNTFEARKIKSGEETEGNIEVVEGLSPSEKVVVSGASLLYSEFALRNNSGSENSSLGFTRN